MLSKKMDFDLYKYGFFVHYVFRISRFSDGRVPETVDELVNSFDVEGFADQIASMGVQYFIFTAWHANTIPLYPSAVNEKWRPGENKSSRRDLLGEIIDAINARGIKMILYTHPRDGHDFDETDKFRTGWNDNTESVEAAKFDYDKWNTYVCELYQELADRYAKKLYGFYTDGTGPYSKKNFKYEQNVQVVNYLKIRDIMKKANPSIIMIQNFFGYIFSDDYAMPEAYFWYQNKYMDQIEKWPAAEKSLATCCFVGNWWPPAGERGADTTRMKPADIAKLTIFEASCSIGGGMCWAGGPYCEGNVWPVGVIEGMSEVGRILRTPCYEESALNAAPSKSYPTISGDTLEALDHKFFTSSYDQRYEYLHIMKADGASVTVDIPAAQDLAKLSAPVSMTDGVKVVSFAENNGGYALTLEGDFSDVDTVVRFERINADDAPVFEWVNDTDKRIRYEGTWGYTFLQEKEETHKTVGTFESDVHETSERGASFFFAFDGSFIEIYGDTRPDAGKALVFIDGVEMAEIDENANDEKVRQLLFRSPDLHGGTHTLYVVSTEEKNFEFDALRVIK